MNACMKKATVMFVIVAMILLMLPSPQVFASAEKTGVTVIADSFIANCETFVITEESRFYVIADMEPSGKLLQTVQLLQREFAADGRPSQVPLELVWGPEEYLASGDVAFSLEAGSGIDPEGYRLEVTNFVKIIAADVEGLLYGGNMLLKALRRVDGNQLSGFVCEDAPDTLQRAVSLDCGRKYYSKNWICNFIREMSWMGYNTLELHFSDDSGFRMDFWDPSYYTTDYRPANDFSWICGSNYTSWTLSAYKNDPDKGKYLSTAEVVEILNTAKEYHIKVIPAFDSPSHLDYLNWTYEQNYKSNPSYSFYSTYDNQTYYADDVDGIINYTNSSGWTTPLKWPYYSTINVVDDHAKAFLFEIYLDIADFFKTYAESDDFSIGADEVNLNTYNLASGYSFTWGFPDFVEYINELNDLLNTKGYTMRMYNDFMGSTTYHAGNYDFADNIEVLYWDSPFEPTTGGDGTKTEPVSYYVDQGRTLYNCIQTHTYYALRITSDGSDARSIYNRQWTFYHANEEDIYHEWYPGNFSEHGDYSEYTEDVPASNLGGAYFLVWCDYACVSSEAEIWNGCYDATTKNTGEYYSLRDRMWSNITKMWNWDIDQSVTFDQFVSLRDGYGDFPGCGTAVNACSEITVLPDATEITAVCPDDCSVYTSYCKLKVLTDTSIMSLPYVETAENRAVCIETASAQESYIAYALLENENDELWYRIKTSSGKTGYLHANDVQMMSLLTDDIIVRDVGTPIGHVQGRKFALTGQVISCYNTLSSVTVSVCQGFGVNGSTLLSENAVVTNNHCNLADHGIRFEELPEGEYTYIIRADYGCYYASGGEIKKYEAECLLEKKYFAVLQTEADQITCAHSYSASVLHPATCETDGEQVCLCASCGNVYEETIPALGHAFTEKIIAASCLNYETVRYTCSVCGYHYDTISEESYSPWQESKPEGIDDNLIQSRDFYRHCDYETVDSYESSLEGYTLIGNSWKKEKAGSISYVSSWPSGFDISSELYAEYDNLSAKVTSFENDTNRCVVESDDTTGYLYYHWCYNNSYYSLSYRSGSYGTFHAYYSTTAPGNYVCDYSDMSYRTAHSTCSNSQWFFVTPVNTQSFTDYTKLYHYERWSEWSDWSDLQDSSTPRHQVEHKVLYRYVRDPLGDHQWSDGTCSVCGLVCEHNMDQGLCTVCGEACNHRFQNHYCIFCGFEKPLLDLYLFGFINGNHYGCEEGYQIPEEFRFVNDRVTLFISQESKVAIKTADSKYCYMADGISDSASSVILYNQLHLEQGYMLIVPGNMLVTFTLTDQGDDTYLLSYSATACPHENHSYDGECLTCKQGVEHLFEDGICVCGRLCEHDWQEGNCDVCGFACEHAVHAADGICVNCGHSVAHQYQLTTVKPDCTTAGFTTYTCVCGYTYTADELKATGHNYIDGVCSVCGYRCIHSWNDGVCNDCTIICRHDMHDLQGRCVNCALSGMHQYRKEVTVPTCTSGGFTTYICICGHTYTADETESVDHSYEGGVCVFCGAEEPRKIPTVTLRYPSLSFEDEVKIHVFFAGENLEEAVQIGLIGYTEEVTSWSIDTAEMVVPGYQQSQDPGVYFCSTPGIHAKALGERLYFSIYVLTADGEYWYSPLRNYSPADYAYNHLSKATTPTDVKTLVAAMLNYGAAAQRYFLYNTDHLVNCDLRAEDRAMVRDYDPDMIAPIGTVIASKNGEFTAVEESFSAKRPAVSFKGAFAIEYFFTPTHSPIGEVQLYYWNQENYDSIDVCTAENATGVLSMTLREDGQYHTSIEGIAAKNLDQTVFAAAVYSDGTKTYCSGILNYHIGAYCRSFASRENDAQELAASTAVYSYYAKAYFRKGV